MKKLSLTVLALAISAALYVACTEIYQTDAPTSVDLNITLPAAPAVSAGGAEPGSLTMSLDPPSITMEVGNNVSTLVTVRDGSGKEIPPEGITVAGLNASIAFLGEIDQRTITFTATGVGVTSAIITASGLQRVIVITVN